LQQIFPKRRYLPICMPSCKCIQQQQQQQQQQQKQQQAQNSVIHSALPPFEQGPCLRGAYCAIFIT